ncbi:unnamed protein product [Alternaria alternata]
MDMDLQWLEANRKRLLTQQDWVGIDPAKPVSLRFQSSREKSRIGKRRRTKKGRSAAPRQRDNEEFRDKDLELANDNFSRMLRGSGPHQNVDNMRIRIGTDAMTSIYSTQLNQYAQSHASSELMLFDQEGPLAQQRSEKPLVNLQLHAATSASEQARVNSRAPSTGEQPQCYSIARRNVASLSSGASEQGGIIGDQLGLQCQPTTITSRQTGSFTHEFRLTHHVHSGERAFRLAFSGSNSAAGSRSRTASDDYQIGETQPFCNPDSALPSKTEHMHQVDIDMEHPVNVEISAGHAIVDEGPWKTYLAISDDSSHSDTARSSFLHDHPTTKQDNEAATNWSQQATHGQGDQSRVSSSSISASLPSLTRRIREPILTHPSGVTAIRRKEPVTTALRSLDEDEKNWRAFVFQSDDKLSLPGMQDHACKTSPLISRYSENASSEYLPISRAVSSVSPIVYESGSELASDAGYDAPDPRSFAPPLRSRNASPLLFGGFVERLTQSEQGDEMLERKVSDKQWVTHASLQNNASSGLTSSKVLVT